MPAHSKEDSKTSATSKEITTKDLVKGISAAIMIAGMTTINLRTVRNVWREEEATDIIT